jgi:hypothetical protein
VAGRAQPALEAPLVGFSGWLVSANASLPLSYGSGGEASGEQTLFHRMILAR